MPDRKTKAPSLEYVGTRFGRAVALGYGMCQRKDGRWVPGFWCRCDCGREWWVTVSNMPRTRSCGCFAHELAAVRQRRYSYSPAVRRIINSYTFNARSRGLEWALDSNEVEALLAMDCYYCGRAPSMTRTARSHVIKYNGIDRLDSAAGYAWANCVAACKDCNRMKSAMTLADFLKQIRRIESYSGGECVG